MRKIDYVLRAAELGCYPFRWSDRLMILGLHGDSRTLRQVRKQEESWLMIARLADLQPSALSTAIPEPSLGYRQPLFGVMAFLQAFFTYLTG
jgi:hypothetical protein